MNDDLRPRGTVEVTCSKPSCAWSFWVGALDPRLPGGPFLCPSCRLEDEAPGAPQLKAVE